MKQLEKYSSFQELKSDDMSDDLSVVREREVKELYSLLQSAAKSVKSSIQIDPKKS